MGSGPWKAQHCGQAAALAPLSASRSARQVGLGLDPGPVAGGQEGGRTCVQCGDGFAPSEDLSCLWGSFSSCKGRDLPQGSRGPFRLCLCGMLIRASCAPHAALPPLPCQGQTSVSATRWSPCLAQGTALGRAHRVSRETSRAPGQADRQVCLSSN